MKKLSEIIESYRIDRPDEWTMDALKRRAEALEVERDSILAELQKANAIIIDLQHNPPKLAKEFLAEIKAEAGLVGYFRGTDDAWRDLTGGPSPEQMTAHRAIEYSSQVRQGEQSGTWLKDSNVNGGKRQGGAE